MKEVLEQKVTEACRELFEVDVRAVLTRTEEQFGDYATNIALQLSKQLQRNPREIGEALATKLRKSLADKIDDISVAGPGFINLKLNDLVLQQALKDQPAKSLAGQTIVAEYSDPNPFKILHAGHLYTSLVGDAVANLMEFAGATVHRVNFGGDVGLHVGKTMWAILQELGGEHQEKLQHISDDEKLDWVSQRYVKGNAAYEENEQAKAEITEINSRVYELHATNDHDNPFAQIYWTCRQWSYDGFESLYKRLNMAPFEKYYPESTVSDLGLQTVKQHIGSVYEASDGAVIFRGEQHGLFTQVFINSDGLPTYAGKDAGLILKKHQDFAPDKSFIITDVAQKDHLAVVMKSISLFAPELVNATTHYTHGQIKLAGGVKMSSRKGNILSADDILDAASEASQLLSEKQNPDVALAAVKYAFLKNRIGGDLVYEPKESVSLEGNSGPYLQYAHARARSILDKVSNSNSQEPSQEPENYNGQFETEERSLARKMTEYAEVIDRAVAELMPHHICTYLYELAQIFNRFYEHNRVIGDARQKARLRLVEHYADLLKTGLDLLGISAPDKM